MVDAALVDRVAAAVKMLRVRFETSLVIREISSQSATHGRSHLNQRRAGDENGARARRGAAGVAATWPWMLPSVRSRRSTARVRHATWPWILTPASTATTLPPPSRCIISSAASLSYTSVRSVAASAYLHASHRMCSQRRFEAIRGIQRYSSVRCVAASAHRHVAHDHNPIAA